MSDEFKTEEPRPTFVIDGRYEVYPSTEHGAWVVMDGERVVSKCARSIADLAFLVGPSAPLMPIPPGATEVKEGECDEA